MSKKEKPEGVYTPDQNEKAWDEAMQSSIRYCAPSVTSFKVESKPRSALSEQVGGDHYQHAGIQPVEYIHAHQMGYLEGAVVKYVTRHLYKNGAEDLKKAIHCLELLLELEYTK